jgi:hypothetical protein
VEYSQHTPNYKNSGFKNLELYLLDRFSAALKDEKFRPKDKSLLFLHTDTIDLTTHLPHTE